MTRAVLEQFGLIRYFDHVQGTDGFPAKPEPDVIVAAMNGLGARPEECLLVGDAPADMEAGRRAGVRTCAVRWGYGDSQEMARWEPDYWIDDPRELLGEPAMKRAVADLSERRKRSRRIRRRCGAWGSSWCS